MNASLKVQPRHLERGAYLYIRQSSMRQVIENVESTKRQYALQGRAIALGWRDEQIIVIDSDQGKSGASASWREGFQRLASDVGMGRAGIVMGLEVSRLARNNADWHRFLEICALADTLILDEDGMYDPASFNDRLLLGLKGTMSEAELHVIKARLRGRILNKARRGEYRCPLPTGFVYDEAGEVAFDPDSQVRETIAHFFDTFSRVGSASQTVKVFRAEGLCFPSRVRNQKATIFQPLTISTAIRTLNNPRYAGAYVYGRRQFGEPWTERSCFENASAMIGSPASRTLIPATSAGNNSSGIRDPRGQRPGIRGRKRIAASGRDSSSARSGRVWPLRAAFARTIRRSTRPTEMVVHLRPRARRPRRAELPVDCRRPDRRSDRKIHRRSDDPRRRRVGPGDPKRD